MIKKDQTYFEQVKACFENGHTPTLKEFQSFSLFFKQVLGVLFGILFGYFKMQGLVAMIIYLVATILLTQLYTKNYLDLDEDEIENIAIFKEGTFQGFACFILVWILSFTFFHYS